ncbi:hypothetical protein J6P52_01500 [bacterium]|nr:hypothetical protein [bacterium]
MYEKVAHIPAKIIPTAIATLAVVPRSNVLKNPKNPETIPPIPANVSFSIDN